MSQWKLARIFLVRHAPVSLPYDQTRPVYGAWDLDIAPACDYEPRLQSLADHLRSTASPFSGLVTSDQRRTRQTWDLLAERGVVNSGKSWAYASFREQNFGKLEGLRFEDYARQHPHNAQKVREDWCHHAAVEGESYADVCARVEGGLRDLVRAVIAQADGASCVSTADSGTIGDTGSTWLVIAHGGTIRAVLHHVAGMPMASALNWQLVNLGLCVVALRWKSAPHHGAVAHVTEDSPVLADPLDGVELFWQVQQWNWSIVSDPSDCSGGIGV